SKRYTGLKPVLSFDVRTVQNSKDKAVSFGPASLPIQYRPQCRQLFPFGRKAQLCESDGQVGGVCQPAKLSLQRPASFGHKTDLTAKSKYRWTGTLFQPRLRR